METSEVPVIKVLAIALPGAEQLGCELEAALKAVHCLELSLEKLSLEDRSANPKLLSRALQRNRPNLVALGVAERDDGSLEEVLGIIRRHDCEISVLAVLGQTAPNQLHRLIALGAADFCLAPLRTEELLPRIVRWASRKPRSGCVFEEVERNLGLQQFLGESRVFLEALSRIPRLARCDGSVLITGETGTGKEMCARAIHHLGPRAAHPFVAVNCGGIPSELVENELFGHDAGAFTSAATSARGLVHEAEGGTLFLDEIDALPLPVQVKFLRFLQDQEYRPLGAKKTVRADLRIIAASNADLEEIVRARKFRSDLFYRLNVLPVKLPALRDRRDDIPLLARHFLAKYAGDSAVPMKALSRAALEKLVSYDWPGNVRELENIIKQAMVFSEQPVITGEDIPLPAPAHPAEAESFKSLKRRAVERFETGYIRDLLAANDGNISRAARAAQKNRRAFWQLMRKYEIAAPTPAPSDGAPKPI